MAIQTSINLYVYTLYRYYILDVSINHCKHIVQIMYKIIVVFAFRNKNRIILIWGREMLTNLIDLIEIVLLIKVQLYNWFTHVLLLTWAF